MSHDSIETVYTELAAPLLQTSYSLATDLRVQSEACLANLQAHAYSLRFAASPKLSLSNLHQPGISGAVFNTRKAMIVLDSLALRCIGSAAAAVGVHPARQPFINLDKVLSKAVTDMD